MIKAASAVLFLLLLTSAAIAIPDTSAAAFEKHADELRTKLKDRGFTVIVERPFIVIGDGSQADVTLWASETIRGTVTRLKHDYFSQDPANILEIWLLTDEISYRKHAKEFFSDEPTTPYGYYLPSKSALVMNIATGGGTLVHEIVHPFVEANFPDCPAWFNEGLGSLYEQSGTVGGHIYGYTNWRLAGLQNGLKQKFIPSFKALTSMSDGEFYREDTGTNYAQARYLCYYLQEKGLLRKFYKDFVANAKTDPSGYKTLHRTLRVRDMKAFRRRWAAFVLKLRF